MATFKVMTWNVENLFADKPQHQSKVAFLADVIAATDPDVVALQEVAGASENNRQSTDGFDDLAAALNASHPEATMSPHPDSRGIRVAFLSKTAFEQTEDIHDLHGNGVLELRDFVARDTETISSMRRGALRVRVTKGGRTIDLVTAHFKSKLVAYRSRVQNKRTQAMGVAVLKRTAEALTVRMHANDLRDVPEAQRVRLIVLGDFNDVPEAQTSLILNGPEGSQIDLERACDPTSAFNREDRGDQHRLINVAPLIHPMRRFSRIYEERGELLDQILASIDLFPKNRGGLRRLPAADSMIEFGGGRLPSVGDNPALRNQELMPDHAPVVARFSI